MPEMYDIPEKRRFARMPVNINITLKKISSPYDAINYDGISFDATAINLSPKGIGFKTSEKLEINTTYSAKIIYKNYNPWILSLRILNEYSSDDDNAYVYGCQFEGFAGKLAKNSLFTELYNSMYNCSEDIEAN